MSYMACTQAQVSNIEIIGTKSSFWLNPNLGAYTTSTLKIFSLIYRKSPCKRPLYVLYGL